MKPPNHQSCPARGVGEVRGLYRRVTNPETGRETWVRFSWCCLDCLTQWHPDVKPDYHEKSSWSWDAQELLTLPPDPGDKRPAAIRFEEMVSRRRRTNTAELQPAPKPIAKFTDARKTPPPPKGGKNYGGGPRLTKSQKRTLANQRRLDQKKLTAAENEIYLRGWEYELRQHGRILHTVREIITQQLQRERKSSVPQFDTLSAQ